MDLEGKQRREKREGWRDIMGFTLLPSEAADCHCSTVRNPAWELPSLPPSLPKDIAPPLVARGGPPGFDLGDGLSFLGSDRRNHPVMLVGVGSGALFPLISDQEGWIFCFRQLFVIEVDKFRWIFHLCFVFFIAL